MVSRRLAIIAGACVAAVVLVAVSAAFGSSLSGSSLSMNPGDSLDVSCPSALSVTNQAASSLTLHCPPRAGTSLSISSVSPAAVKASGPDNVTALSAATASFIPPANSLLIAQTTANNPMAGENTSQVVSGGGLTWTRVTFRNVSDGGVDGGSETWSASVGVGPRAMSITTRFAHTFPSDSWAGFRVVLKVEVLTASNGAVPMLGASASASAASGLPTVSLPVRVGSLVFAGGVLRGGDVEWLFFQSGLAQLLPRLLAGATAEREIIASQRPVIGGGE